jgi:prepilin peptidase CpaA
MESLLSSIYWLSVAAFAGAALYGAYSDIRSRIIPNWVSVVIAASLLPAALISPSDLSDILIRYGIGLAMLAVCALLFARGMIGGGDAKLLPACSVWMGPVGIAGFVILTAIMGGVLAVITLTTRKRGTKGDNNEPRNDKTPQGLPYGVAISLSAILMIVLKPVLP